MSSILDAKAQPFVQQLAFLERCFLILWLGWRLRRIIIVVSLLALRDCYGLLIVSVGEHTEVLCPGLAMDDMLRISVPLRRYPPKKLRKSGLTQAEHHDSHLAEPRRPIPVLFIV